ncbi:MAG: 7-cyano-7-deazaguanine synthase [Lyngbya sp. HA4199-MV5]|jgi:7-cyano-7-deazaguanine synthase|nr:7-cyano-7-deazaguanine synthase [Lyngbya sp. HA4199-MV5]
MQEPCGVTVLLSGRIDSTALVAFYLSRGIVVRGIHFDYGQPCFVGEQRAVQRIASHYKTPITTINLGLSITSDNRVNASKT